MTSESYQLNPHSQELTKAFSFFAKQFEGVFHTGDAMRQLYATDASAYQEMPLAVAIPANTADIQRLIALAQKLGVGLIPRTAGTSLAGQVVGSGIVVDVSRNFNQILEINEQDRTVWVEPGVIRNELNMALKPHGMLFGPETSTQNRAMLGGMVGNNSCGSNSIKYGSTRDHLLEVEGYLSDGSYVRFGELTKEEFQEKCAGPDCLETRIYCEIRDLLADVANREEIVREFPKASIPRRNTGYALDLLMDAEVFDAASDDKFNFCKLIAGSEGTLFFATKIKLNCIPLPPSTTGLLCAHFETVHQALRATQLAVKSDCYACELIDDYILECTNRSIEHRQNRFFVEGNPGAILVVDIRGETEEEVTRVCQQIIQQFQEHQLGYAYPILFGEDTDKIWNLRKAGLGLLGNIPGDSKPAPVIEDTCVDVEDLADYIAEFDQLLNDKFDLVCVHYAHAGSGELHLRPILNLKTEEGNRLFRDVAQLSAKLVKKYRGSLSGEHGDGRLRGEFLKQMIGEKNYELVCQVKRIWDPEGRFNPNKIVDTPSMNRGLRYMPSHRPASIQTYFDFSETHGMLGAVEMCNGSGDCRKTEHTGGTMCPSYMATRKEEDSTRARANLLRQAITQPASEKPLARNDLKEVLDLCLSCKGCKKECPSTVDMGKLKAEFLQHYYDAHGTPARVKRIADFTRLARWASKTPWAWNTAFGNSMLRKRLNQLVGFHPERSIPKFAKQTFEKWFAKRKPHPGAGVVARVLLFNDEFTNYQDVHIGKAAVELLEFLGYSVLLPRHVESGRTWLSAGLLREAKQRIDDNIRNLSPLVSNETPIVGLEPSAILTLRDEYPELCDPTLRDQAHHLADHTWTFEEFMSREYSAGRISSERFTKKSVGIQLHGHCFQKALVGQQPSIQALSIPENYEVQVIPSGCCGMAGSFGYEAEHYDISMQIGELILFPTVRELSQETVIAAAGTSCRHQILDGTGRSAVHPVEILKAAINKAIPN